METGKKDGGKNYSVKKAVLQAELKKNKEWDIAICVVGMCNVSE